MAAEKAKEASGCAKCTRAPSGCSMLNEQFGPRCLRFDWNLRVEGFSVASVRAFPIKLRADTISVNSALPRTIESMSLLPFAAPLAANAARIPDLRGRRAEPITSRTPAVLIAEVLGHGGLDCQERMGILELA